MRRSAILRRIRLYLCVMILGLVASGLMAFPLTWELKLLARFLPIPWVVQVRDALIDTDARHPFLAYGTDWLAFAHLCIAAAFVAPLALICGPLRQIPFLHRLVDRSFGVFGAVPLLLVPREIDRLERGAVQ